MEKVNQLQEKVVQLLYAYGPKIIGAIIVFVVGLYVINMITRLLTKTLSKRHIDVSLQTFFGSLVGVGLKVLLLVSVAGMIGIQTTSFVAVIGALGLAVGLALQGSLANFAGGVLTLVFKPYKVGDLIEAQGQTGVVKEIQIFNTVLLTADQKTVILANGAVSNGTIVNYSRHGSLRVDITMAVAPDNDLEKVRSVVMQTMTSNSKVLKDPAPFFGVNAVGDGKVTIAIRPYASVDHYWDVFFGIQEEIKLAFDKNGIKAPVPAMITFQKQL
jgi:small conductance mechanosensitive channel